MSHGTLRRIRCIVAFGLADVILGFASIPSGAQPHGMTQPPVFTPEVQVTPAAHSVAATSAISVVVAFIEPHYHYQVVGTVTLTSGAYTSGAVSVNQQVPSANLAIVIPSGTLAPGRHLLTANFVPDPSVSSYLNSAVGNGSVLVTSGPATTTSLAMTSNGNVVSQVPAGSAVVLKATVQADGVPVSSGQVLFCNPDAGLCTDLNALAVAQLTSSGTATLAIHPKLGNHRYVAAFKGTPNSSLSLSESKSSPVNLSVSGSFPTNTTLASDGYLDALVVTLSEAGYPSVPTGTVSLRDANNGGALMDTFSLPAGGVDWSINFNHPPDLEWIAAPYSADSLVAADFNGDGNLDLAVANESTNNVRLFLGKGDGTFSLSADVTVSGGPASLVVSDFNQDGRLDLAIAGQDGTLSVLIGNGDGTFTPSPQTIAGVGSYVVVGDFNWDGIPDLAVANKGTSNLAILLGNGDGTFTSGAILAIDGAPEAVATADFDLDGITDLIVATDSTNLPILLGNGDGTFRPLPVQTVYSSCYTSCYAVVAGNFEGGEVPDVVIASQSSAYNGVTLIPGSWLVYNGIAQSSHQLASSQNRYSIATGDFNADGKLDLVLGQWNTTSNSTAVLLGAGDGTFTSGNGVDLTITNPSTGGNPAFAVGDLNGDGVSDIAAANSSGIVSIFLTDVAITETIEDSFFLGPKTYAAYATYSGDTFFSSSVSSQVPFTAANRLSPIVIATPSATVLSAGLPLSISVTVSAGMNPTPTGTATVTMGGYTSPPTLLNQGAATITIPGGTLGPGSYSLFATYTPDAASSASYDSNVSGTTTETLYAPISGSYTLVASTPAPVKRGTSATLGITATSTDGYSSSATLTSCTLNDGGPANSVANTPTCAITSSAITVNGTGAVVTVTTAAATIAMNARPHLPGTKGVWAESGAVLALLIFLGIPARSRSWCAILCPFVLIISLCYLTACGSGNSGGGGGGGGTGDPGTASGEYTFRVTAMGSDSARTSATTIFTVTVN